MWHLDEGGHMTPNSLSDQKWLDNAAALTAEFRRIELVEIAQ
jgi:hypothetical protein